MQIKSVRDTYGIQTECPHNMSSDIFKDVKVIHPVGGYNCLFECPYFGSIDQVSLEGNTCTINCNFGKNYQLIDHLTLLM